MTDETSFQAAGPTGVELFQRSLLSNDAETDHSETDRASSPEVRPGRLSLRSTFAQLECKS